MGYRINGDYPLTGRMGRYWINGDYLLTGRMGRYRINRAAWGVSKIIVDWARLCSNNLLLIKKLLIKSKVMNLKIYTFFISEENQKKRLQIKHK